MNIDILKKVKMTRGLASDPRFKSRERAMVEGQGAMVEGQGKAISCREEKRLQISEIFMGNLIVEVNWLFD